MIAERIGAVVKALAHLGFETLAILTESAKVLITHLDAALDEMAAKTQ